VSAPGCGHRPRGLFALVFAVALVGCGDAPEERSAPPEPPAQARPEPAPRLHDGGAGARDFRAAFTHGAGRVRVVALVSPT
jgi:hypothetical protein